MNTKITIKNFRVFDEDGVTFELNPLTILTGCNSSGKSSMVKAILLLNDFLKQIKKSLDNNEEIDLASYKIDFSKYPTNLLGRFDKVVHKGSSTNKVSIEYSTYSRMLSKEVYVDLVFSSDPNDELNNAYLDSITMKTEDGVFYSSSKKDGSWINFLLIKEVCFDFLRCETNIHQYFGLCSNLEDGKVSQKEVYEYRDALCSYLKDSYRRIDILNYVRTANSKSPIACWNNFQTEQLKSNLLFLNIPVVNELDKIQKKDFLSYVEDNFLEKAKTTIEDPDCLSPDSLIDNSCKIANEYINSEEVSFSNFLIKYEEALLQSFPVVTVFRRNPYLFDSNRFSLTLEQILSSEKWNDHSIDFFYLLYKTVRTWNKLAHPKSVAKKHYDPVKGMELDFAFFQPFDMGNSIFSCLKKFLSVALKEIICPDWCDLIEYVGSSRSQVKRLYTLESMDDFSEQLKQYFESKRKYNENANDYCKGREYIPDSFMNKWVKIFGIGDRITLTFDEEGLGVQIWIHKTAKSKGSLLADEGYGITQLIRLLLQIETTILTAKGLPANGLLGMGDLDCVDGFDSNKFKYEPQTIAIEEPEIHLHPSYQSLLTEMFFDAYNRYNIHFIIETHSEYLIRKFQVMIADKENALTTNNVSLNYVEGYRSGVSTNRKIGITEDGRLKDSFGEGFFDEAGGLSRQLLKLSL